MSWESWKEAGERGPEAGGLRMRKLLLATAVVLALAGCRRSGTVSVPDVKETVATVKPGSDGLTNEQRNVKMRLEQENQPGSVKHLYVFSSASGQCLFYSTVKGKVTSSGKRLSPGTVAVGAFAESPYRKWSGIDVTIGGKEHMTSEVLQDDGTYGGSIEYLFWFDVNGRYSQLYPSAGTTIFVSNEPVSLKSVTVNLENRPSPEKK